MSSGLRKVVIDARMVGPIGHGIAKYVELIAEGLGRLHERKPLGYEPIFLVRPGVKIQDFGVIEMDVPFLNPKELIRIPQTLMQVQADLYHSPSFSSLVWSPCPVAVTVHDLIHLEFGEWREKIYYRTLLKPFIRKASAVMTVSETSRELIASWSGIAKDKIAVVYNPIPKESRHLFSEDQLKEALGKLGLEKGRYFLSLASSKPHKNIPTLLHAHARYVEEARAHGEVPWPLVVTANGLDAQEQVKALGSVDEHTAIFLIKGAGGLFYPSLVEGFGRPPLEAALEGVPIAVSRIPAHEEALSVLSAREVHWVDALDEEGWSQAFRKCAGGEIPGASQMSRERIASRFSLAAAAEHMDRIYRRVLGLS